VKGKAGEATAGSDALAQMLRSAVALELKGQRATAARVYEDVVRSLPTSALDVVLRAARLLRARKRHGQAAFALRHALKRDPSSQAAWIELGTTLCEGGQISKAQLAFRQSLCMAPGSFPLLMRLGQVDALLSLTTEEQWIQRALACELDQPNAHLRLAKIRLPGPGYLAVLATAHRVLKPRTYVEIGVASGGSLAQVRYPTLAIGVDPAPSVRRRISVPATVYRMKSDEFFQEVNLLEVLGGTPFDVGFIDGLHSFDQTLRDFANLESRSSSRSALFLHDCLPLDQRTGSWPRTTSFWSGDSWKILPYLLDQRADLGVHLIPCWPTGLVVVTNLDAKRGLSSVGFGKLQQYRSLSISEFYRRYVSRIATVRNDTASHLAFFGGLASTLIDRE
jgi:hypothetical protein